MPADRLTMQQIKDILRLRYDVGLPMREIARSLNISLGVVGKYLKIANELVINWPIPPDMDEATFMRKLRPYSSVDIDKFSSPDFAAIHQELRRKGVTLQLLWEEYAEANPADHYSYSYYCLLYREWRAHLSPVMRQNHTPDDKMFVDYCGPTIPIINSITREVRQAQIFVSVLGASNYTYAEAT